MADIKIRDEKHSQVLSERLSDNDTCNFQSTIGVEKLNDDCRRIHLQKSNKWDAAKDVLQVEERLRYLSDLQRTPRQYKKKADEYWSAGICESRSKRPRLSHEEQPYEHDEGLSTLTPEELRARLKDLGIKTRVRNVTRLVDMYRVALQSHL